MKRLLLISALLLVGCGQGQGEEEEEQRRNQEIDAQISDMIRRTDLSANNYIEVSNNVTVLGEKLFLDNRLSGNQDISCSTCHSLTTSGDDIPLSIGAGGSGLSVNRTQETAKVIRRNSSPLYALGQGQSFAFHDGRVSFINGNLTTPTQLSASITSVFDKAIDAQALFPILSNDEMRGQSGENALANISNDEAVLQTLLSTRILSDSAYVQAFQSAFPGVNTFTAGHMGHAIGTFIKNKFNVRDTPFDLYLNGNSTALSLSQKRGLQVFLGKGQCIRCHSGVNLQDDEFHSVGIPHIFPLVSSLADDQGRYEISGNSNDLYKFKTPSLRNVAKTAPYMHNGSLKTLDDVINHYNNVNFSLFNYSLANLATESYSETILLDSNATRNSIRFNIIDNGALKRGLRLSATERADLKSFLESLSD
ncbi:hypothetical protein A9Q84_19165 [Halobacteriovorax marinus]|uniref:Cytochrome c domain-containing protein n=1 Tax=Halobacteriovorax marinus TaxID=97084 RepID=A0A1Y5F8U2_9BACT|nr:hypothetical protein A9Q84_19165 [Halobacteriovorax marinus]